MGGVALLAAFLLAGAAALRFACPRLNAQIRLWLGLCLGLIEMMWLPSLYAFFTGFTARAQVLALLTAALAALCCIAKARFAGGIRALDKSRTRASAPPVSLALLLVIPLLVLSAVLQFTHVLRAVDGELMCGQSTYGDLCLHLGIATGLRGAAYPPQYTLLPGTLLGYPFLFDALSSSMLLFGSSLQTAFIVPGVLAMGLVFWGFVIFAWELTRDARAVAVSYLLVFLNGGLGFLYALDFWPSDPSRLWAVFTDYYRAPANQPDLNLRWVNVICDLMIPQRTLLAGWMAVLPALYLLARAMRTGQRRLFVALGLWAGAMPMIHTHSFVALAVISAGCMALCVPRAENRRRMLENFLLYALLAAAPALPQLLTWTFPQTIGGGSLALRFNWVNWNDGGGGLIDGYFWFWIKNVGPSYILLAPAALNAPRRVRPLAAGALALYAVAELIQFQPNPYDNNKLFYVAFLVVMPMVGALLVKIWDRLRGIRLRWVLAAFFMAVSLASGALSLAREAVSQYVLFDEGEARAAAFIEQNTERDAVFLTGTQHTNVPAALCGRAVVCGTPSYLFYHGVDYTAQIEAERAMFEEPEASSSLFEAYAIDYIYLSSHELGQFDVDEAALESRYPIIYNQGGVRIYAVSRAIDRNQKNGV